MHRVTGTIHLAMGDSLSCMATEMLSTNSNFSLWDKGRSIVLLSRTKFAKNTIFVGNMTDTLDSLLNIVMKKSTWKDYMDQVLDITTLNNSNTNEEILPRTMLQDVYLIFAYLNVTLVLFTFSFLYHKNICLHRKNKLSSK